MSSADLAAADASWWPGRAVPTRHPEFRNPRTANCINQGSEVQWNVKHS